MDTQKSIHSLKSTAAFDQMRKNFQKNGAELAKKCNAIYNFEVIENKGGPVLVCWIVDLKSGNGTVKQGSHPNADATITMEDSDWVEVSNRKLNPQMALLMGSMKVKGDIKKSNFFTSDFFREETEDEKRKPKVFDEEKDDFF